MPKKDETPLPADPAALKTYTVLSPVATDHVCEVGEVIELNDRNAAELLAIGVIAPCSESGV